MAANQYIPVTVHQAEVRVCIVGASRYYYCLLWDIWLGTLI